MFDHQSWSSQSADPVAYAPHIRKKPLAGLTPRRILILMAEGDLADITSYFRSDVVYAQNSSFPLTNPNIISI